MAAPADATLDRNAAHNPLDAVEVPHPMSKRWIPYKHSNGIVIYYHQNITEGHEFVGGEYMVSSIVRGTPEQCLAALTHRSSTTTILGPATAVEVLSRDGDSQVLHLQLVPPLGSGLCSSLCAPRHAVVQQLLKKEPCGIHCLMFSSLQQQQQAQQLLQQHQQKQHQQRRHHCHSRTEQKQQQGLRHHHHHSQHHHPLLQQQQPQQQLWLRAVIRACRWLDNWLGSSQAWLRLASPSNSSSSGGGSWGLGARLWRPVLLDVAGGYTISGLDGFEDNASPESLVTCIIKVDLGGWLAERGPGGWLYRPALGLGLVDQLVERLLTSVTLINDEVEQQRFRSYPFALLEESVSEARGSTPPAAAMQKEEQEAAAAAAAGSGSTAARHSSSRRRSGSLTHSAAGVAAQRPCCSPPAGTQQQEQQQGSSGGCQHGTLLGTLQELLLNLSGLTSWGFAARFFPSSSSRERRQYEAVLAEQGSQDGFGVWGPSRASSASGLSGSSSSSEEAGAGAAAAAAGSLFDQLVGLDDQGQQATGFCDPAVWSQLHVPGAPSFFKVRGPHYLTDRGKVPAGPPAYCLLSVDLVTTPTAVQHLARFLPSVRRCRASSCFVFNLMVPAADSVLNLVMTFGSRQHWRDLTLSSNSSSSGGGGGGDSSSGSGSNNSSGYCMVNGRNSDSSSSSNHSGNAASSSSSLANGSSSARTCTCSSGSSSSEPCQWSGLDHVLYRFIHAADGERSGILKMIPHIEVGSWLIKQTVGTTPFIVGRKLATAYHLTDRYMEVDIDVTTCKTASYIVQSIRGVTTSMVIDLAFLLEGQRPAELPEQLLGAVRFAHLDMATAVPLDISREVPPWPQPWSQQ